jgi:hypothetical protein
MARHKRDYCGKQFTARINFKCTPTQRAVLAGAARSHAATISDLTRDIVFAHLAETPITMAARRHLEIDANFRSLTTAANAHKANGNLLNQIARHLHTTQELGPYAADLREALRLFTVVDETLLTATKKLLAA